MTVAEEAVVSIGLVTIINVSKVAEFPPPLVVLDAEVETVIVIVFSVTLVTV